MKNTLLCKCLALFATPSNKKNTTCFNGILALFLVVMVGVNVMGQTTIYSTNFGTTAVTSSSTFVAGWTSPNYQIGGNAPTNMTISTSSSSSTYSTPITASGGVNLADGSSSPAIGTATATLAGQVNTTGYTTIELAFGYRASSASYTATVTLDWSPDGSTWNSISLGTLTRDGSWRSINGSNWLSLPSGAENQSNLRFRFTFGRTSTSGNFRIDDFTVRGVSQCSTPETVTSPSASNGSSQSLITWTNGACYDQMMLVASTSNFTSTLPSGDGTAYTANSASFTDTNNTAFDGGVVLFKGTGSSATVTSLTNGTTYNFKIYTRKGTSWVASTSFSATPALAEYFWDADANTTSGTGGTGTWDVSTTSNWRTPSSTGALTTWSTNTSPLAAVFEGNAGVVSIPSGTFTAPNFKFNTTGYTLATSSTSATVLSGSINLGNNVGLTFSPTVSPNVNTTTSGTVSVGSISGSGTANIIINSAQGTAVNIAQRLNLAIANSSISVPINIVSVGGTGTGTVAGIVGTAVGTSLSSAATITNNTAIKTMIGATSGNDITVNGAIIGSADLMFAAGYGGGAGTITLNSANSYTGETIFNAANSGVIKLGVNDALPTGTNVTFGYASGNGGSLDLNGKNQTVSSIINGGFGSSVNRIFNNGTTDATLTINGSTSPAAFVFGIQDGTTNKTSLVKAGSGTLILDGTTTTGGNTYTGLTTVSGGTLRLNKSGGTTIPNTNNVTVDGGTLKVSTNQTLNNLTLTSGTVIIDAGVTLTITGTITRTSGVIQGTATSNLVISGTSGTIAFDQTTPGTTNVLKNLTISGSGTTTLGNALNITAGSSSGTVTVGAGATLATGGNLTLKSDALGTASVGNSAGTITGNVTVERYIPAKRAWRALTSPVIGSSNNSVFYNWQNNGSTIVNTGVEIWSNTSTDASVTNAGLSSSLLSYNSSSNSWTPVTNTASAPLFTSSINNPFMVFVTGPYASTSTNITNLNTFATTLKATGSLLTGNQTYTTTAGKYSFIGNPYASPLDLSVMMNNTHNATASFGGNVWVWDANASGLNAVGTYNLYTSGTYTNLTSNPVVSAGTQIQSGQAFFVKSTDGAPFTIKEAHKGSTFSNSVFRTSSLPELLRVGLYKQVNNEWSGRDGAMTVILSNVDANQASNKMANGTENIAFTKNGASFASNHHLPLVASDVLNVKVWNTTSGSTYKLKLNTEEFTATNLEATLEDLFTNARTPLNLDGSAVEYLFTVTADALSTGDRFRIVFQSSQLGNNIPKSNGFSIVPNPVTGDSFRVNLGSLATGTYSYSICNTLGQEVEKGSINKELQNTNYEVKMNNSASGIYIMKIKGNDNSVFTAKIIKK